MAFLTPTKSVGQGALQIAHIRYSGTDVLTVVTAAADFDLTVVEPYTLLALGGGMTAEITNAPLTKFVVPATGLYRCVYRVRGIHDTDAQTVIINLGVNGSALTPTAKSEMLVESAVSNVDLGIDTLLYLNRSDYVKPRIQLGDAAASGLLEVTAFEFILYKL